MRAFRLIELLADHLKSNEWMILSVGDLHACVYGDRFRVGQTLDNNQEAVVDLADFGYFPGGMVFAFKPRPRRKARGSPTLCFTEVRGDELVECEIEQVFDRVDWRRVVGVLMSRARWERSMSEHQALELEMRERMDRSLKPYSVHTG